MATPKPEIQEEPLPVYTDANIKTIKHVHIYKGKKWWCEVLLQTIYGRKNVAPYLWLWDVETKKWKRKFKFSITNKEVWGKIKEAVDKLIEEL